MLGVALKAGDGALGGAVFGEGSVGGHAWRPDPTHHDASLVL